MLAGATLASTPQQQRAHQQADAGADCREDEALDEHLTDEAPPRRADRGADPELAAARDAARQLKTGEIGAGDEQHEGRGADEIEHALAERAAALRVDRSHAAGQLLVDHGKLRDQSLGDRGHAAPGLVDRDARLQPAHHAEVVREAGLDLLGREAQSAPEIDATRRRFEPCGHHADDDARLVEETNLAPDDVRVRAKATTPQSFREDDVAAAGRRVLVAQHAADERRHLEHAEVRARDVAHDELLGLAGAGQTRARLEVAVRGQRVKGVRVAQPPVIEDRRDRVDVGRVRLVVRLPDFDQAVGVRDRAAA